MPLPSQWKNFPGSVATTKLASLYPRKHYGQDEKKCNKVMHLLYLGCLQAQTWTKMAQNLWTVLQKTAFDLEIRMLRNNIWIFLRICYNVVNLYKK